MHAIGWLAFVLVVLCPSAVAQIHLQSRTLDVSPEATTGFLRELMSQQRAAMHGFATFARAPGNSERRALERNGVLILDQFQRNTYYVRVNKAVNERALEQSSFTVQLTAIAPQDRVAPWLWGGEVERYIVRSRDERSHSYVLTPEGHLKVVVEMHSDIAAAQAERLLARNALSSTRRSEHTWDAVLTRASLLRLADADAVRWIAPGSLPSIPENDGTRQVLNVDALQTLVDPAKCVLHGITGSGVRVGVFHNEMDLHRDYANRVIFKQTLKDARPHPTHAAGTIAGDGVLSSGVDSKSIPNGGTPCQWRGMAPGAAVIGGRIADGVNLAVHRDYIVKRGMDVANHSYAISFDGEYSHDDATMDTLIRGDARSAGKPIPGRLKVLSAGNHGQDPKEGGNQLGYFSLTKQGKNALIVGGWDVVHGSIDETSSLGPAHDGRIKPDVVAPGRTVNGPAGDGVKSSGYCRMDQNVPEALTAACLGFQFDEERRNFYQVIRGTSMAAHATSGVLALVLQQYRVKVGKKAPRPSTLRALLIHTARDQLGGPWTPNEDGEVRAFKGPDFVTGWGLIDAKAAVDAVSARLLREDVLRHCQVKTYVFTVPPGTAGSTRVTLAWDDVAAAANSANTARKLVNDLDLVLTDPAGKRHFPWQLDQKIVDAAGNGIGDDAQLCGTAIRVVRRFMPIANPHWENPGDPSNVNDTIPQGGVPQASRGRDHLNNVEVVDAPAMPGTWTVQVSGFQVTTATQRYSLVGQAFHVSPKHATAPCPARSGTCSDGHARSSACGRFTHECEAKIGS